MQHYNTFVTGFSKKYYDAIAIHTLGSWELLEGNKLWVVDNFPKFTTSQIVEIINGDNIYPRDKFYGSNDGKVKKFWKKGRSFLHALKNSNTKYVTWIDSDVQIKKKFNFDDFIPNEDEIASVLVNENEFQIESGFVIVNTEHKDFELFCNLYESAWYDGTLQTLYKPWDGDVLMYVLKKMPYRDLRNNNIKKPQGFDHSILEEYMHHYSGKRQKKFVRNHEEQDT